MWLERRLTPTSVTNSGLHVFLKGISDDLMLGFSFSSLPQGSESERLMGVIAWAKGSGEVISGLVTNMLCASKTHSSSLPLTTQLQQSNSSHVISQSFR